MRGPGCAREQEEESKRRTYASTPSPTPHTHTHKLMHNSSATLEVPPDPTSQTLNPKIPKPKCLCTTNQNN